MKRRANGEGSIRQRADGRWECQIVLPSGERKSLYARSQREVLEKRKAELDRAAAGLPAGADKQSVGEYLTTWLEGKKTSLRASTWTRYEIFVRKDILPEFGRTKLAQLTPAHVQRLYARRLEAGKAPVSVRHMHALMHEAFGDAAKWGMVTRNVVALVDAPAAPRREMQALSEDQVRDLFTAAAGDRLEALYVLAVTCGMREGELFGLRWKDLDLEKRMLQVRQTVSWATNTPTFGEPKTAKSRRRIELTQLAIAALVAHRKAQKLERIRNAAEWQDLDLVFTNEVGGPLHPSNMTIRSYRPLLERAGLPRIRFHELRHTAASIALANGVPTKIVSEMLGHASTSITDDIYAHVTPTMQRATAKMFDEVLAAR